MRGQCKPQSPRFWKLRRIPRLVCKTQGKGRWVGSLLLLRWWLWHVWEAGLAFWAFLRLWTGRKWRVWVRRVRYEPKGVGFRSGVCNFAVCCSKVRSVWIWRAKWVDEYLLKHVVDVFYVLPELNNIGIVINLLESIQKMLRNITNIFDLWFINFIIICLLPIIHCTPIVPASTPLLNFPSNYINTLSFLSKNVSLSK